MIRNHLGKKALVFGFIFILISLNIIPTITAQSNDDITICITAGFLSHLNFDKPNMRSIGRGVTMYVVNNWSEPIWIFFQLDYYTISGEPLESLGFGQELGYAMEPNNSSINSVSRFVQLPCQITVSIEVGSFETGGFKTVSRSGFQFHRWVFFPQEL